MSAKVTTELAKGPRNLRERLWKGKNQRSPWKPNCKRRVDVVIGLAKSPWESSPYDVWHLSPLNNESSGVLKLRSLPRSPGSSDRCHLCWEFGASELPPGSTVVSGEAHCGKTHWGPLPVEDMNYLLAIKHCVVEIHHLVRWFSHSNSSSWLFTGGKFDVP